MVMKLLRNDKKIKQIIHCLQLEKYIVTKQFFFSENYA